MIVKALLVAAVVLAGASQPAGCQSHAPKVQNVDIQDVSAFPRCQDDQGRGLVHPCSTGSDADGWVVWVVGVADCPAKTKQDKDKVKCLNAAK